MVIAGEVEKIVVVVVGAAEQSFPINHASEKDCQMLKAGKVKRERKKFKRAKFLLHNCTVGDSLCSAQLGSEIGHWLIQFPYRLISSTWLITFVQPAHFCFVYVCVFAEDVLFAYSISANL